MAHVWHIYRRELGAYFTSPIAYVVMTLFLVILSVFFVNDVMQFVSGYARVMMEMEMRGPRGMEDINFNPSQFVVRPFFFQIAVVLLFVAPMITMRLFAEENQLGTIELLLTAPVRDIEVILGKFLAAVTVFVILFLLTVPYMVWLSFKAELEPGPIATGYLGLFLVALTFSGLGIFFSSLTENQIVAAALTFATLLFLWLLSAFVETNTVTGGMASFVRNASLIERFQNFAEGVINLGDVIYYVSIALFGIFLTVNVLDTKVH